MSKETTKPTTIPEVDPTASVEDQIKQAELAAKLMELEIKRQELEAKSLEIQERKYHIQDLKTKLADREITERQLKEDREQQGRTIAQQDATDKYRFTICTHKKGGLVSPRDQRVLSTGGNAAQYAVLKHQMINGDIWVRCLRCGKTWAPPVMNNFFFDAKGRSVAPVDGEFSRDKFEKAVELAPHSSQRIRFDAKTTPALHMEHVDEPDPDVYSPARHSEQFAEPPPV